MAPRYHALAVLVLLLAGPLLVSALSDKVRGRGTALVRTVPLLLALWPLQQTRRAPPSRGAHSHSQSALLIAMLSQGVIYLDDFTFDKVRLVFFWGGGYPFTGEAVAKQQQDALVLGVVIWSCIERGVQIYEQAAYDIH